MCVAVLLAGCGGASILGGEADGGDDAGSWAVCVRNLQPTFAELDAKVFKVSCGATGTACHSSSGAVYSGGLDLSGDAWAALVRDGGVPANNIAGSVSGLRRVVPGDAAQSFLYLKLATTRPDDTRYGSGMPFGRPGSVCPSTLQAVAAWIDQGAQR
jgi:hypothetical protein